MNINYKNLSGIGAAVILLLSVAIIVGYPLAVIWAVNTLFASLALPYTFWTWLSVVIMGTFFKGKIVTKAKD